MARSTIPLGEKIDKSMSDQVVQEFFDFKMLTGERPTDLKIGEDGWQDICAEFKNACNWVPVDRGTGFCTKFNGMRVEITGPGRSFEVYSDRPPVTLQGIIGANS